MGDDVRAFYDALAERYDLLFADWHASVLRQAEVLDRLIADALGPGPHAVLDAACGIGTQAIGLAGRGHRVRGTDLSPAAVARARREAALAGVRIELDVADLRDLAETLPGSYDVVLACDNALPHLPTDEDVRLGVAGMAAKLRPGGLFLASLRDYDRLIAERPRTDSLRVIDDAVGRRIAFQVWDWTDDGAGYRLHQFVVRQEGDGWRTDHAATVYRALLRAELEAAIRAAGLVGTAWHEPAASGFYQPIVTARR